jgi:hypothetical protein
MSHLFFTSLIFLSGMIFSVCKAEEPIEAIAFGSCLKQTRPQPIWKSVLASKPDVFVLLGDNIYGDTRDMEKLRSRWNAFAAVPGFKKLRADCRLLAIWDDHDYGENDAGREFPQKAESQKLFLDFLGEPKESERRKTPGIYDSVTLGPKGKTGSVHSPGHPLLPLPSQTFSQAGKRKGSLWPRRLGEGGPSWRSPMEMVGGISSPASGPSYYCIEHSGGFNDSWVGNMGEFPN